MEISGIHHFLCVSITTLLFISILGEQLPPRRLQRFADSLFAL